MKRNSRAGNWKTVELAAYCLKNSWACGLLPNCFPTGHDKSTTHQKHPLRLLAGCLFWIKETVELAVENKSWACCLLPEGMWTKSVRLSTTHLCRSSLLLNCHRHHCIVVIVIVITILDIITVITITVITWDFNLLAISSVRIGGMTSVDAQVLLLHTQNCEAVSVPLREKMP